MNMVTEMYSLPAYNGIDPNPLIFFFYIFFFGFMFADVAYGIIIFAVSLAITKLYKPKKTMGYMFQLGQYLGISTFICGIFVGGFFGNVLEVIYDTFLPGVAMPGWMETFCNGIIVNPVADPMKVLIIAVCIGAVHLVFGQLVHIYMGFRDGEGVDALLDVVPWWCLFASIGLVVAGLPWWCILIGCLILVATQGPAQEGPVWQAVRRHRVAVRCHQLAVRHFVLCPSDGPDAGDLGHCPGVQHLGFSGRTHGSGAWSCSWWCS